MSEDSEIKGWMTELAPELDRRVAALAAIDPQDIVQDVFVMAMVRQQAFESYDDFRHWCLTRARWRALDELARRQWFARESEKEIEELSAAESDPDRIALYRAIEDLPPKQKLVVRERIAGYLTPEIAERHGMKANTVRSLWRHAKQTLVTRFEDGRNED